MPTKKFLRPSLLAVAAAATCLSAQAQPTTATLSEVVVSASGFEQELKQAPASISVVTREDLEKKSFRDLAEALQGVEGIDVRGSTGKTGGFNISMRGMPSDYTLVLIDGRRPNPAGETTPNGFGEALNSLIPPMSAIERIEVVRGPMSTLYGSDAMGGVINIITRKVAKKWNGSVQIEGSLPETDGQGAMQKSSFYINGPIQQDKLGLAIRGSYNNRHGSDLKHDGSNGSFSTRGPAPTKMNQQSLGARLTLTPTNTDEFWLDADIARSAYDNRRCEIGTLDYGCGRTNASGYTDELQFDRDQFGIGYKGKLSIGLLEASLTHTANETLGRTISTAAANAQASLQNNNALSSMAGKHREVASSSTSADAKLVTPLGQNHLLTSGLQYVRSDAEDGFLTLAGKSKVTQNTWAVFAEDEWSITEKLTATGGLRYDNHNKFGGHFSPRAYLVWNATDLVSFKGGISRGFKAPKMNQLINGFAGYTSQGATPTYGNPDLKPETSTSKEFGVLLDNQQGWNGSATLFHNKVNNRVTTQSCANNPAICDNQRTGNFYYNAQEGKTWGLELATKWKLSPSFDLKAGYTWTDSELIANNAVVGKFSDTAKHVASTTLNWNANSQTAVWLQAEHRGKSRRFNTQPTSGDDLAEYNAMGENYKAYSMLHLGGSYKVTPQVTLSATVYNLLDKNFREVSTVNGKIYSPYVGGKGSIPDGRTLWLRANVQF